MVERRTLTDLVNDALKKEVDLMEKKNGGRFTATVKVKEPKPQKHRLKPEKPKEGTSTKRASVATRKGEAKRGIAALLSPKVEAANVVADVRVSAYVTPEVLERLDAEADRRRKAGNRRTANISAIIRKLVMEHLTEN